MTKNTIMFGAAVAVLSNLAAAHAQDTEETEARVFDAITVTAQKREESSQDVPIAIAAYNEDAITDLGIANLSDLADYVPGVVLRDERGAGQPTWVIRGVGLEDFNSNNTPTAGVFYDEVYLVSNALAGIGLFDVERIEILKGPQGGLYGRNTTGGAVSLISKRPDLDEYSGYVQASYGRFDRYGLQGGVGGPIVEDKLGFRLAAMTDQGGGWQDSLVTPEDDEWGDRDFFGAKASLLFTPTPEFEVLLKVDAGYDKSEGVLARATGTYSVDGMGFNGDLPAQNCDAINAGRRDDDNCLTYASRFDPNARRPNEQSENGDVVLSEPINEIDNNWTGITLNAAYDLGFAEFRSITSYFDYEYYQIYDFDATELSLSDSNSEFPNIDATFEQFTQEFRLTSTGDGPFNWLLGLMYAEDTKTQLAWFLFPDAVANPANLGLLGAAADLEQKTDHFGVYANASYDITPTVNINGSIRYTDETQDYEYVSLVQISQVTADIFGLVGITLDPSEIITTIPDTTGIGSAIPAVGTLFAEPFDPAAFAAASALISPSTDGSLLQETELEEHWSGHLGVDWTPIDNMLLYAKYSRGFKSGGFYGAAATVPEEVQPYGEETNDAFEIGVKSQFWNQLQVNAALYHYQYSNAVGLVTVVNTIDPSSTLTILDALGDAEHTGLDLDILWQPPQVPGLLLGASGAWIDAEYTSEDVTSIDAFGNDVPVAGLQRNYAPKYSTTFNAQYERSLTPALTGRVGALYAWTDDLRPRESFSTDPDFGAFQIESYGTLDLRAAIVNEDQNWELALLGTNVTGEAYTTSTSESLGTYFDLPGAPASWTVQFRKDF